MAASRTFPLHPPIHPNAPSSSYLHTPSSQQQSQSLPRTSTVPLPPHMTAAGVKNHTIEWTNELDGYIDDTIHSEFQDASVKKLSSFINDSFNSTVDLYERYQRLTALYQTLLPLHIHSTSSSTSQSPIKRASSNVDLLSMLTSPASGSVEQPAMGSNISADTFAGGRFNFVPLTSSIGTTASNKSSISQFDNEDDEHDADNDRCCDLEDTMETIGFNIIETILPYTVIPAHSHASMASPTPTPSLSRTASPLPPSSPLNESSLNYDTSISDYSSPLIRQQAHEIVSAVCRQCPPREIFLLLLSYLEQHRDLTVAYSLFPYIERCIQRETSSKRSDMLEQVFGVIMVIWRKGLDHEDEISIKFIIQLTDTLDSLTSSLSRLEDDEVAYEREQGILLTVVLRCAQWLLAEHWDTLVQDTHLQRKLRRYSSAEKNELLQSKYQHMLVNRIPNMIRCVLHCGRLPVILQALEHTLPASFITPPEALRQTSLSTYGWNNGKGAQNDGKQDSESKDKSQAHEDHDVEPESKSKVESKNRPPLSRPGSVQYSNWSLPGISALVTLFLCLSKFQQNMGHNSYDVRSNILVAIDQARHEFPDVYDLIPADRPLFTLQCYPLLVVLLADAHRHPAYLPLAIHLWKMLLVEIPGCSLDEEFLLEANESAHGRNFWLLFELCINAIVQIKEENARQEMVNILYQMLDLLDPQARFEFLRRMIPTCPYSNINALLLTKLKDNIHAATQKRSGSQRSLTISLQYSVYTTTDVADLLATVLDNAKHNVTDAVDGLIAALNVVKYILLKQSASPITNSPASYLKHAATFRVIMDTKEFYTKHIASLLDEAQTAEQSIRLQIEHLDNNNTIFQAASPNDALLSQLTLLTQLTDETKSLI